MKKSLVIWIVLGLLIAAGLVSILVRSGKVETLPLDRSTTGDWVKGSSYANVTLIEYGDFQCPACAAYSGMVGEIAETYGPNITIVFRHFPLTQIHRNAFLGAQAAEAAGRQGKFWEMHDKLFLEQGQWSEARNARDLFRQYAEQLGLNADTFAADLDDSAIAEKIRRDQKHGMSVGVGGTPTFFLNGAAIQTPGSLQEFKTLIEAALQNAPTRTFTDADFAGAAVAHTSADIAIIVNGKNSMLPASSTSEYIKTADNGTVLHRHKEGITLGYALETLGVTLTDTCLTISGVESCTNSENSLKVFVNGKRTVNGSRYVFQTGDKILISFGPLTDSTLETQLANIPDNAKKHQEEDHDKNMQAHSETSS